MRPRSLEVVFLGATAPKLFELTRPGAELLVRSLPCVRELVGHAIQRGLQRRELAAFLISRSGMQPRQVLPGQFYMVTRWCTQRQLLLRPDAETNNAFPYCLIEAAQRTQIEVLLPRAKGRPDRG